MQRLINTKIITRPIWLLALVGLLADLASQMLYPILPVYLQSIGFSVALIGLLEGIAEATAGLSKGYFGRLSDQSGRRLPFVRLGYALSALAKPMTALFALPAWVFATRTLDRLGKGVRTAARDALLADESAPQNRGQVFGFHRALDTLGAVLGPLAALVYLSFFPGRYVPLFLLAFGPGLLSIGLTFLLTDRTARASPQPTDPSVPTAPGPTASGQTASVFAFAHYWRASPPEYRRVVGGLLVFALFNSSDIFLLLKMKEAGLDDTTVLGLYVFYNLVYALMAYPVGRLADQIGLKPTLLVGLGLFALVYEGMVVADRLPMFVALLALYGVYAAATEGVAKAWISTISGPRDTATAIGTYAGLSSLGALAANTLAGGLWSAFGAAVTFAVTGAATLAVIVYLAALEGLPRGVTALRKPGVVINSDGDLTGSEIEPARYAVADRSSTVTLTRSAYLALILLIACLGIGTVYMSYVAITTAVRSPNSVAVASGSRTGRSDESAFATMTGQSTVSQQPAEPAPTSRALPNSPDLAGRYELTIPAGARSNPFTIVHLLTTKRRSAPWLDLPIQPVALKELSTGNLGEPLINRVLVKPVSPRRPVRLYTVAAVYTHVYARPNRRSPRRVFVSLGKKVVMTALTERNGFVYVIYTTRKGQTRKGWLSKRALRSVRLPTDLYSF